MSETKFTPEQIVKITSKKSGFTEAELLWVAKKVIGTWEHLYGDLIMSKLEELNDELFRRWIEKESYDQDHK